MPQTFDLNNVTLLQKRDGSIPEKHAILTIQEIMQNVSLGGIGYSTFAEDISCEQGEQASLIRNYKF